jgi:glucan phosphoethanolaminetransferase (alkaline phosphatase superfamily)
MIQRIQTLFWILSFVFLLLLFPFSLATFKSMNGEFILYLNELTTAKGETIDGFSPSYIPAIFIGTLLFLDFICIFLFKNRRMQIRLSSLSILLHIIFIIYLFYYIDGVPVRLNPPMEGYTIHFSYSLLFILVSMVMNVMAANFVKKDEDLIRSADRIR